MFRYYLYFCAFFVVVSLCCAYHEIMFYPIIIIPSLTLYHIRNIRSDVHEENEDEREALVQEQRYCRTRARKLFLETNRRRK